MQNNALMDNARLLLLAVNDALERGASPLALSFYGQAAEALAAGRIDEYISLFQQGEHYASL